MYVQRRRRGGFKLIELATASVILCIIVGVVVPNYIQLKDRGREAEIKQSLHAIQIAVERFAVDASHGEYPQYLIGGQPGRTLEYTSDPLLRKGYLQAYPSNPFQREGREVLDYQDVLPDSTILESDPLRPGTPEASRCGYRFGWRGTRMGSVLADPRFMEWNYVNRGTVPEPVPTYADIEYDFWDIGNRAGYHTYLPGEFFYKASGPIVFRDRLGCGWWPLEQNQVDCYMLGAYGRLKNPGRDIFGQERQITCMHHPGRPSNEYGPPHGDTSQTQIVVWPWTRSQVGNPAALEGSPYSPAARQSGSVQLHYGNPNGIRDSLCLVLTAAQDLPAKKPLSVAWP